MRRFKFTLESLRTVRLRREHEALEAYARVLLERERAAEQLRLAQQALTAAQADWRQQAQTGCPAAQMARHALHCQTLAVKRQDKLALLGDAERKTQNALKTMLLARQRREAVDKFEARQRRAYDAAVLRAEQKFLDELGRRDLDSAPFFGGATGQRAGAGVRGADRRSARSLALRNTSGLAAAFHP